ncbi:peptidase, S54 family [Candidatus Magnetobacterium bavaricum]|uniref:Peptidase, S54 family n=1 Tax=Candidatus Magnetobacterium bavaricum TaxID=29290 RepID=A0A0F3GMB7_9BACT|nr:peptidase, S54 family [Candidatus Magnetobacterium bavaricum]
MLERRMGRGQFLLAYFISGILGNMFAAFIYGTIKGETLHALGASGAIAGMMGVFAIRCYFKNMSFPIPLLGPLNINIRMNSIVLIGFFFAGDLSKGLDQIGGENKSNIGHWIHIGGMMAGLAYAYIKGMQHQAVIERHIEKARDILQSGVGLNDAETEVNLVLKEDPNNVEALEILAKNIKTAFGRTPQGEELYVRLIRLLLKSNPTEAARVFKQYNENYGGLRDMQLFMKIANVFHKVTKEPEMASRCLRMIGVEGWKEDEEEDKETARTRETALFELATISQQTGDKNKALLYWELFVERYPGSKSIPKATRNINKLKGKR